jgi:integrase/recombinase XerD
MTEPSEQTVKNFVVIDAWLEWMQHSRGRSPRTIEQYSMALKKLQNFMQGRSLMEADPVELETFCGLWLHKQGIVAKSRVPYISAVKGFYQYAQARGLLKTNVAQGIGHPKTGRSLPQTISLENAEKLMWAPDLSTFIGMRDAAMLSLMMGCGLRVSGLVGVNESHFTNVQIEGQVRMALRVTEKGNKTRIVPVPKEAEMLVRVYLEHEEMLEMDRDLPMVNGQVDRVVFVSVRNTILPEHEYRGEKRRLTRKAVHDMMQRYGKRLDIPMSELHPKAMRHLYGTELNEHDVPLGDIQNLMGHADMKTTTIYTHLAARKKFKNVDKSNPLANMRTPVSELLKRLPAST